MTVISVETNKDGEIALHLDAQTIWLTREDALEVVKLIGNALIGGQPDDLPSPSPLDEGDTTSG